MLIVAFNHVSEFCPEVQGLQLADWSILPAETAQSHFEWFVVFNPDGRHLYPLKWACFRQAGLLRKGGDSIDSGRICTS